MKTINKIILFVTTPLILIRYTAATILVGLNIWLFSGIANILQGTLGLDFNETFVVTLAGSLVLLMIAGVEKGYAESGGMMTNIEAKRIKIMWLIGLGFYAVALLFALYGAIDVIESNKGIYNYMTFDWFGLITPKKIEKTMTYTSLSFTVIKALGAGGVDYIAGVLIDKEVSRYFNDDVKVNKSINNKADDALMVEFKSKRDEVLRILNSDEITTAGFNKAKGLIGNIKSFATRAYEEANKSFITTEVRTLETLLKDKEGLVK